MGIATDYDQLRPHRTMLRDTSRTFAFAQALSRVVTPESVVLDMGTGTGILGMLAARLGARKVISLERTEMAEVARDIVRDNRLDDVIEVVRVDATKHDVGQPVDVIVSEWLGGIGVDENLLPSLLEVRDRWLRDGGTMLPSSVTSWMAPTFDPYLEDEFNFFDGRPYGLDLSRIRALSSQELYYGRHHLTSESLRCAPHAMWTVDVATTPLAEASKPFSSKARFVFERPVKVNCLMMWFTATVADGIELTCGPDSDTCWGRTVAPFRSVLHVPAGVPLSVGVEVEGAGPGWVYTRWTYEVDGRSGGEGDNRLALL